MTGANLLTVRWMEIPNLMAERVDKTYLQLKVFPQKNVHKKKISKDFELQNTNLAPMHNSSSSKEPDDVNLTLRPETSKSFEVPENRLSKEPGKKVCQ